MRTAPLVLALLVAGCIDGTGDTTPTPAPTIDLAAPFTEVSTQSGCQEVDLVFLIDIAEAQAALPSGFTAADATTLAAATPIPSGKGAVFAAFVNCESAEGFAGPVEEHQITILAQRPDVAGEREAALYDFYETMRYTPNPEELSVYGALGWDAFPANVSVAIDASSGSTSVTQDGATLVDAQVTTPASQALSGIGRFWHDLPTGIAYTDYKLTGDQVLGGATCTLAEGSPLATLARTTTCTPTNSLGSGIVAFDPEVTIAYLPGVHAK